MSQHNLVKAARPTARRGAQRHHRTAAHSRLVAGMVAIGLGAAMVSGSAIASADDGAGAPDNASRSGTHAPRGGADDPHSSAPAGGGARATAAALAEAPVSPVVYHCMAIGCTEGPGLPDPDAPVPDTDAPRPDPDVLLPDPDVHAFVCAAIGCPRLSDVPLPKPEVQLQECSITGCEGISDRPYPDVLLPDPDVPLADPGCGGASSGDGQQAQDNCDVPSIYEEG